MLTYVEPSYIQTKQQQTSTRNTPKLHCIFIILSEKCLKLQVTVYSASSTVSAIFGFLQQSKLKVNLYLSETLFVRNFIHLHVKGNLINFTDLKSTRINFEIACPVSQTDPKCTCLELKLICSDLQRIYQ